MNTERTNLFAHTEQPAAGIQYVGYLSLNRETDGRVTLCVRSPGDAVQSTSGTISLSPELLESFAVAILSHLHGEPLPEAVTDDMVGRFLGWPLPENFSPDGGVTFQAPAVGWPSGTNLLNALQAKEMLRHVLGA